MKSKLLKNYVIFKELRKFKVCSAFRINKKTKINSIFYFILAPAPQIVRSKRSSDGWNIPETVGKAHFQRVTTIYYVTAQNLISPQDHNQLYYVTAQSHSQHHYLTVT